MVHSLSGMRSLTTHLRLWPRRCLSFSVAGVHGCLISMLLLCSPPQIIAQKRILRDWGGVRIFEDRQGIHILITTSSPRRIANLALTDPDGRVRRAAVEKLWDQDVLAQVAQQDPEFEVRLAAVERIS